MNALLDHYASQFAQREHALPGRSLPWMVHARRQAMARFQRIGFPTPRMENWKYTRVDPWVERPFTLTDPACVGLDPTDLEPFLPDCPGMARLVFVNGFWSRRLSRLEALPEGVKVGSMATVLATDPAAVQSHLPPLPEGADEGFALLNQSLWRDGAYLRLAGEATLARPLQLLFIATPSAEPVFTLPCNLIEVAPGARARVVESYFTLGESGHFTDAWTTLVVGREAHLDHLLVLGESARAYHVGALQATVGAGGRLVSRTFANGGRMVRRNLHAHLAGEGAEVTLDGLFLATGKQHLDFHTWIHHDQSRTRSRQLYKGVLNGAARGVFNGAILVPSGVRETRSRQVSANLLLSATAEIDTKPQLEIHAEAVQCSHGAAVGSLDAEALFALRSRGVDEVRAKTLLIEGFADEVLQPVAPPALRAWLARSLAFGRMLT